MTILIRGMDMPDDCKTCDLCHYDGFMGFCFVNDEKIADEGRREDCPLVEVPPHGRLIDALEKQVGKKPDYQYEIIKKHMDKAKAPFCSVCGADLLDDANDCYEYCPECGQKIDWSE